MNASLYIGNDQTVEVTGVLNERTGAYINNATVTAVLKTLAGAEVSGQTWPLTLDYVVASDGDYQGNLDDVLVLQEHKRYEVEVTADGGAGLKGFWQFIVTAKKRKPGE